MLEQHEFDLAAGAFAHGLDGVASGDAGGRHAIENRCGGGTLDAQRFQFADVLLHGGGVAPGPAGNDGLFDRDLAAPCIGAALQRQTEVGHARSWHKLLGCRTNVAGDQPR